MAQLIVYAGPNGSGKSTILSAFPPTCAYVNADEIQKLLGCTPLQAAQNAEKTREFFLQNGDDFSFETVLSTTRNLDLMRRAKDNGYMVKCIYILTVNPKINIARVVARVKHGGHDVPHDKISERYVRALSLIPQVINACDEFYLFDNSFERVDGEPSLIAFLHDGMLQLVPNDLWTQEKLQALVRGQYPNHFLNLTE